MGAVGFVKAIAGGIGGALLWVLRTVLSERLFRGVAIDMVRGTCRWLATVIPGDLDDEILGRIVDALDDLEKRHRAGELD